MNVTLYGILLRSKCTNTFGIFIKPQITVLDKPLIILLEDESIVAGLIEYKIARSAYSYEHYSNGIQGLDAIKARKPALVILDVMLPGMSGFEVLQNLREDPELKDTPVIMLTAKSRDSDLKTGFSMRVDDYLSKPFKVSELMLRIENILSKKNR